MVPGGKESRTAVRKPAYGRTQLFLPSSTTLHREVKCLGGVVRYDQASIYHSVHSCLDKPDISCWHCCEPLTVREEIVPLPKLYDMTEKTYHVYGACCSPGCAKAYIIEHTSFDRGHHLNNLVKMLRECYGVCDPIVEAPPRAALSRFGGTFSTSKLPKVGCRLVSPPFVSYTMIVEEHTGHTVTPASSIPTAPPTASSSSVVEDAESLDRPQPPGLFTAFAERVQCGDEPAPPSAPPPKRKRATGSSSSTPAVVTGGPMSKFRKES